MLIYTVVSTDVEWLILRGCFIICVRTCTSVGDVGEGVDCDATASCLLIGCFEESRDTKPPFCFETGNGSDAPFCISAVEYGSVAEMSPFKTRGGFGGLGCAIVRLALIGPLILWLLIGPFIVPPFFIGRRVLPFVFLLFRVCDFERAFLGGDRKLKRSSSS